MVAVGRWVGQCRDNEKAEDEEMAEWGVAAGFLACLTASR